MFKAELRTEQNLVTEFFEKVFQTKKIVRSYLFLGNNKEDKISVAQALTKILNCQTNKGLWQKKSVEEENQNSLFATDEFTEKNTIYKEACEVCQSCEWINAETHPKTPITVETSGAKNIIQVETIRKLQEELSQSSEHFRVIIFEDASSQTLNSSSSAALLKTIEEANPNTMFLFFADAKDTVLSTIVSRCQHIYFKSKSSAETNENVLDIEKQINDFITSANLNDGLERISFSEELAKEDRNDLLKAFSLVEAKLASMELDLDSAKAIFDIEALIRDIRAFIKPKAAIKNFLDRLSKLKPVQVGV